MSLTGMVNGTVMVDGIAVKEGPRIVMAGCGHWIASNWLESGEVAMDARGDKLNYPKGYHLRLCSKCLSRIEWEEEHGHKHAWSDWSVPFHSDSPYTPPGPWIQRIMCTSCNEIRERSVLLPWLQEVKQRTAP